MRTALNERTSSVLTWLLVGVALTLSFCSVVTWLEHTRFLVDELHLVWVFLYALFAFVAAVIAWGGNFRPVPLLLSAAVAGWVLFLLITQIGLLDWSVRALLAACVGGATCLMAVVLIIWRRTRKPE